MLQPLAMLNGRCKPMQLCFFISMCESCTKALAVCNADTARAILSHILHILIMKPNWVALSMFYSDPVVTVTALKEIR